MPKKNYWRINHNIRANEARVVDQEGKMVGLMSVSQALKKAQEAGLDLVEIAPNAKPVVVKITDFGKFKYQEEKKARKAKTKNPELKELRFTPFIGDADYQTRVKRIKTFLDNGDKIRVVVRYKGRQMGAKKIGYDLLEKVLDEVRDRVNVDMEPKFIGRHLAMVISPTSKAKKQELKENKKNENKDEN